MDKHREEHGLNKSLEAIGLPKSTYYYRKKKMVSYNEKYKHLERSRGQALNHD